MLSAKADWIKRKITEIADGRSCRNYTETFGDEYRIVYRCLIRFVSYLLNETLIFVISLCSGQILYPALVVKYAFPFPTTRVIDIIDGSFWTRRSPVFHDDVIKWKHFPRYWPFVRGIHRSPVNSPHKDQWRGALMFSLICVWINSWANNRVAGD